VFVCSAWDIPAKDNKMAKNNMIFLFFRMVALFIGFFCPANCSPFSLFLFALNLKRFCGI